MKYTIDTRQIAESVDKAFEVAETSLNAAFKKADKMWEEYWNIADHIYFPFVSLHSTTNGQRQFPPYDIVEYPDGKVQLRLAIAGYTKDRIKVELEQNILIITGMGNSATETTQGSANISSLSGTCGSAPVFRHHGISSTTFIRTFELNVHAIVDNVSLVDGMLVITVSVKTPEKIERTNIEIK